MFSLKEKTKFEIKYFVESIYFGVERKDTTPPVITLNGNSEILINLNEQYTEQGATATDETDGNLTDQIQIIGTVNTLTPGTYYITYSVSDSTGNSAEIKRKVLVKSSSSVDVGGGDDGGSGNGGNSGNGSGAGNGSDGNSGNGENSGGNGSGNGGNSGGGAGNGSNSGSSNGSNGHNDGGHSASGISGVIKGKKGVQDFAKQNPAPSPTDKEKTSPSSLREKRSNPEKENEKEENGQKAKLFALQSICLKLKSEKRYLSKGTKLPEVKTLQNFLKSQEYLKIWRTTTYFGNLTKQALQEFQEDNNIKPASGIFDKNLASFLDKNCKNIKTKQYYIELRMNKRIKEKLTRNITIEQIAQYRKDLKKGIKIPEDVKKAIEDSKDLITKEILKQAFNLNVDQEIIDGINKLMPVYEINDKYRVSHFLSQVAVESGLRPIEEDGRYPFWYIKKYYSKSNYLNFYKNWNYYKNNSERILNYLYRDRMCNGDENSGDGFRYRGRGLIQLTGKCNYTKFTKWYNKKYPNDKQDFVKKPNLLLQPKYAVIGAFYYWHSKKINRIANGSSKSIIKKVTYAVNGGYNGLYDEKKSWGIQYGRISRFKQIYKIIKNKL